MHLFCGGDFSDLTNFYPVTFVWGGGGRGEQAQAQMLENTLFKGWSVYKKRGRVCETPAPRDLKLHTSPS